MKGAVIKGLKIANYVVGRLVARKGKELSDDNDNYVIMYNQEKINCLSPFFGVQGNTRIPESIVNQYGDRIERLNHMLAGETISFITDAQELFFSILYKDLITPTNMSLIGSCGVDVYMHQGQRYVWKASVSPAYFFEMYVTKKIELPKGEKQILIYLPSYASIEMFNLTIKKGRLIQRWDIKEGKDEISVYGSSITQGCAASRPGLSYTNILGRLLNMKVANYGYSESALGQEGMVNYIANRHSKIYIVEYDHNASVEQLKINHMNVYFMIRKCNNNALIILMSRFSGGLSITEQEEYERVQIIRKTYEEGLMRHDRNLMFINGTNFFENQDNFFSDDRHPNDRGMFMIAKLIHDRIKADKATGE